MSIARTKTTKAAKEYSCEKCREPILKGESYISYKVGFRSRFVHRRHDLPGCRPRSSELESSMLSGAYAAIESAEDALSAGGFESPEDIASVMEEAAEGLREVAQQYSDAADSMGGAGEEMQERAEMIEAAADSFEEDDFTDYHTECESCDGSGKDTCPGCDGTGEADGSDPDTEEPETCEQCDGTGEVDCEAEGCDEGQVWDPGAAVEAAQSLLSDAELP